jgi:chorismate mutase
VSDQSSDPLVKGLRDQIDEADAAILEALNRRVSVVQQLHRHKVEQGYDLVDAAREDSIVRRLQDANRGPLSPGEVDALVRFLLDVTRGASTRLRQA